MEKNLVEEHKIISYLSFRLSDESFALNVAGVVNILEHTEVTKVPHAPDYMKGIINLRGEVLPVVDANKLLGFEETSITSKSCILVLKTTIDGVTFNLGALVDAVQEVLEIEDKEILPPPSIGSSFKSSLLSGVKHLDDRFIMILDLTQLLDKQMVQELKDVQKSQA